MLRAFARYMHRHRRQADGSLRAADNWQKGIPPEAYESSLLRHVLTAWLLWRGYAPEPERVGSEWVTPTLEDALCGILFNASGLLFELLVRPDGVRPRRPQ